jgi:hypothetical protein
MGWLDPPDPEYNPLEDGDRVAAALELVREKLLKDCEFLYELVTDYLTNDARGINRVEQAVEEMYSDDLADAKHEAGRDAYEAKYDRTYDND